MSAEAKRGPGRPPRYVRYKGRIVVGLSGPKPPLTADNGGWPDGRYYSTHNDPKTGRRVYFGTDLAKAVELFDEWMASLNKKKAKKKRKKRRRR